jgi:ATP-dependent RNA circularization protein (DNA/RNA ligase family)
MFRKFEKTYRIKLSGFEAPGKLNLSDEEVKLLLAGRLVLEEKMDGANTGIIRFAESFRLQKRGGLVDKFEHEQFNRFKAWANENYDKIMSIPPGFIFYGEFLYAQHHIYYDSLPDWFLVFEVFSIAKNQYIDYYTRKEMCDAVGLHMVPLIDIGFFTKEDLIKKMPKVSAHGPRAEGMVIKKYSKKNYMRTKLVWPSFVKEINESDHWMKKNIRINKLKGK